jgi:hypothetical protein
MPTKSQEESISSMQRTKHGEDGASPLISVLDGLGSEGGVSEHTGGA